MTVSDTYKLETEIAGLKEKLKKNENMMISLKAELGTSRKFIAEQYREFKEVQEFFEISQDNLPLHYRQTMKKLLGIKK